MSPLIDDITDKYDIKLAVIDVFDLSSDTIPNERARSLQYETLDHLSLSLNKVNKHNELYGRENIFDIFPVIRNHTKWKEFLDPEKPYQIPLERDFYKGFRPYFSLNHEHWNRHVKKYKWRKKKFKVKKDGVLDEVRKQKYLEIISKLEERNIMMVFTSSPIFHKAIKPGYWAHLYAVQNFLDSLDIPFIDYNRLYDKLKLKKEHFKDPTHLNTNGALIVSENMTDYILKNYDFDESLQSRTIKKGNRYFLMDSKERDILFHKFFEKNHKMRDSMGIKKIMLYKVFEDRLELVIQGNKRRLKKKKFKLRFKFPENEFQKVTDLKNLSRNKKRMDYRGNFQNWIDFEGNSYHVFQFNAPFTKLEDVKLFLGSKKKVFEIDSLVLKD